MCCNVAECEMCEQPVLSGSTHSVHVQLCLELLLTMTLRNRDRAGLLWPMLHDVLAGVMSAEATTVPGADMHSWVSQLQAAESHRTGH